jgi:hypothetical protein
MLNVRVADTFVAVILLVGCLFARGRIFLDQKRFHYYPSFCNGLTVAYVFVDLIPEVEKVRSFLLANTPDMPHVLGGRIVYVALMVGFVVFYGLQRIVMGAEVDEDPRAKVKSLANFRVRLALNGWYVGFICYCLTTNLLKTTGQLAYFTVAMGLHFVVIGNSLYKVYGERYDRVGVWVLGACALAGWGIDLFYQFPGALVAISTAFLFGGVIVNALILELIEEREGRLFPFFLGAAGYAALLLVMDWVGK